MSARIKTVEARGHLIACAVWEFLQRQKRLELVPWVSNPRSRDYDPVKTAEMAGYHKALDEVERLIIEETNRARDWSLVSA